MEKKIKKNAGLCRIIRLTRGEVCMEHPNDITMLEMLGGHIGEHDQQSLRDHIENCPACQIRRQEFSRTWADLDAIQADASQRDLTDRVKLAITSPSRTSWYINSKPLLRIAASVLVATALGYFAGKFSVQNSEEYLQTSVAQVLYLDTLLPSSPTGWADPILETDPEPEH